MIPRQAVTVIDSPDKHTGDDPVAARSIVTIDPPPLLNSTQTVDDLDRTRYSDVSLHSDNAAPRSLWSDGVTSVRGLATDGNYLWVSGSGSGLGEGDSVHAFRLFDDPATLNVNEYGTLDLDRGLGFGEFSENGVFTDGETMWGVEVGDSTARAVSLDGGERVTALEFELHEDNDNARGIWSNGVTMFVVDETDTKIYTYRVGDVVVSGVPAPGVAHVSAGGYHSCALGGSGSDTEVSCSGGYALSDSDASVPSAGTGRHFELVSAGGFHSCGLLDNGAVKCWGNNDYGQAPADRAHSDTMLSYVSMDAGVWHTCAVVDDGMLVCWGNRAWFNDSGKAHHHPQRDRYNAPRRAQPDNARSVSAGYWHTCWTYGTTTAPKVICTGDNSLKQARWKKKTLS
ncbi:RCC1 domain-containing protein [Candidatus Poriferisodalis sp.]|uniref:RCC1 domain-containing protein n=1 Tax=Candidatus Poriferisodalis sp. TaxID=3101277 RepID=UPI003AF4CD95